MGSQQPPQSDQQAPTKLVVRNLAPNLSREQFETSVQAFCQDELEWMRFHPGKDKAVKIRRPYAFVKLRTPELVPIFKQAMESTAMPGPHGDSYYCNVELAPFQKVPRPSKRPDTKAGTYESDPYFKEFVKRMESEDEASKKGPTILATTTIDAPETPAPVVTPLMEAIIAKHTPGSTPKHPEKVPLVPAPVAAASGVENRPPAASSTADAPLQPMTTKPAGKKKPSRPSPKPSPGPGSKLPPGPRTPAAAAVKDSPSQQAQAAAAQAAAAQAAARIGSMVVPGPARPASKSSGATDTKAAGTLENGRAELPPMASSPATPQPSHNGSAPSCTSDAASPTAHRTPAGRFRPAGQTPSPQTTPLTHNRKPSPDDESAQYAAAAAARAAAAFESNGGLPVVIRPARGEMQAGRRSRGGPGAMVMQRGVRDALQRAGLQMPAREKEAANPGAGAGE